MRAHGNFFFFVPVFVVLWSCSTAPERPLEIDNIRSLSESQLELANKELDHGNYSDALEMLDEARRYAVNADDPSLRIRTNLSRGNAFFYLGRTEEAFSVWAETQSEAEENNNGELIAVCRIHMARGRLLAALVAGEDAASAALSARDETAGAMASIKDRMYTAFGWLVIALAERELKNFQEAEAAVKKALAIHEKGRYLEQTAYDWYLVASIRSTGGMYAAAEAAITEAISFDRRAENSRGLAADWRALGDIRKKAGDLSGAGTAYKRSAEIYRSLGMETEARAAERRMDPS
jgi:tetratricopeptide (TPR) repeat protein